MKNNPPLFRLKNAMLPQKERKAFDASLLKLDFKAAGDGPGGFEGYGAVFGNIDRDTEVIAKGAFAESLPAFVRDGFIAEAHDWECGIATIDAAYEDDYGLYIKCTFHGDAESQDVRLKTMERLDRNKSVGLSVGFMPDEWTWDEETGIRTITKATLYEVSIVTVPANPMAQVVAAKSAGQLPATVREFEKFLRDAGFPKEKACAVASKGFACGMQDEPDKGGSVPPSDDEGQAEADALYLQFQAQESGVRI